MVIETNCEQALLQPTLTVLQQFSFSSSLPSWNCLRWSQSNRLIGLNLCDKLVIFQMNINHAISEGTINRKQWNEENLRFCSVTIKPENSFTFNVGTLASDKHNLRNIFPIAPKKPVTRFQYFEFSPSIPYKNYNLLGAITEDYCFLLYLQLGFQRWNLIHNFSLFLNQHFIQKNWDNLKGEIDFATHKQRLEFLWTTNFCWSQHCTDDDNKTEYKLYSSTKNGNICCWTVSLSTQDGQPKCKTSIEQIIQTDLSDIVTIQLFEHILLVESADGRIVVFDVQHQQLDKRINLWQEKDNLPCYNVCFNWVDDLIEIVFHKVTSIIFCRLSSDFTIKLIHQNLLDEDIELLAIYNYDDRGSYYATSFSSPARLFTFSHRNGHTGEILLTEVKLPFLLGSKVSLFGFDCSSNKSLMGLVSGNNTFCSKSSVAKNVDVYFCTNRSPSSVSQFLHNFIIDNNPQNVKDNLNIRDYLYLFRYYLSTGQGDEYVKHLLPQLIDKYNKVDKMTWKDTSEHLTLLKIVRFMIKRFWEMSIFPESRWFDQKMLARVGHLLQTISGCITQLSMQMTINALSTGKSSNGAKQGVQHFSASSLKCEQLVSLHNIHRQSAINNLPKGAMTQVEKTLKCKDKSVLASHGSILAGTEHFQLVKGKSLADTLNRCPLCDRAITNVNWSRCDKCDLLLDVCANSQLIIDPVQYDMSLCSGCFESKLISPRVWPSPVMAPFPYSYDCCLFCL